MTPDPLDVVLCPGCGRPVEVVTHTDEGGPWCEATCRRKGCGYVIAEGTDYPPLTLRQRLAGLRDTETWNGVDLTAWLLAVAARLGPDNVGQP